MTISGIRFNEVQYLKDNPDVAAAVEKGEFSSGKEHYERHGKNEEGRDAGFFSEKLYLNANPDVAEAVKDGQFENGFEHYSIFGKNEVRENKIFEEKNIAQKKEEDLNNILLANLDKNELLKMFDKNKDSQLDYTEKDYAVYSFIDTNANNHVDYDELANFGTNMDMVDANYYEAADESYSDRFLTDVFSTINKLSGEQKQSFIENGSQIRIAEKLTDAFPHLAGEQPRGWAENMTWDWVDGVHSPESRAVGIAATNQVSENGGFAESTRTSGVLMHELGHAFDHNAGNKPHNQSLEFLLNYYNDVFNMSEEEKAELSYFTQPGTAGPSEAFAELFAIKNLGHGCNNLEKQDELMLEAFSNTYNNFVLPYA